MYPLFLNLRMVVVLSKGIILCENVTLAFVYQWERKPTLSLALDFQNGLPWEVITEIRTGMCDRKIWLREHP